MHSRHFLFASIYVPCNLHFLRTCCNIPRTASPRPLYPRGCGAVCPGMDHTSVPHAPLKSIPLNKVSTLSRTKLYLCFPSAKDPSADGLHCVKASTNARSCPPKSSDGGCAAAEALPARSRQSFWFALWAFCFPMDVAARVVLTGKSWHQRMSLSYSHCPERLDPDTTTRNQLSVPAVIMSHRDVQTLAQRGRGSLLQTPRGH